MGTDTAFSNLVEEYLAIASKEGFEKVLELPFVSSRGDREKFFILWKSGEGLLLSFDTFSGKYVNGGNVWFNLELNHGGWPDHCSGGLAKIMERRIFVGDIDCRDVLRENLENLRSQGTFLSTWHERTFIWLLHYGDLENKAYDYKKINAERIAMLPEEVRDAIAGAAAPQPPPTLQAREGEAE